MARELLSHHPQLACALFQALILHNIVDRSVVEVKVPITQGFSSVPDSVCLNRQRMQAQAAATSASSRPPPQAPQSQQPYAAPHVPQAPPPAINPQLAQYQTPQNYPPINYAMPPQNAMYGQPQAAAPMPNYYQAQPPPTPTPVLQPPVQPSLNLGGDPNNSDQQKVRPSTFLHSHIC